jgi:hypothetical protein
MRSYNRSLTNTILMYHCFVTKKDSFRTIKNRLVGRQRPPIRPTADVSNEVDQPTGSAVRAPQRPPVRPPPTDISNVAEQPTGSAVRAQRPPLRPSPEAVKPELPLGPASRGQRPSNVIPEVPAAEHEARGQRPSSLHEPKHVEEEVGHAVEDEEGPQPMFKSFPIASDVKHRPAPVAEVPR